MDVQDTLTEKAGPFPVWVWGLLLGGVVVGVMWFNNRNDYTDTVTGDEYTATGTDSLSGMDDALQYDGDNSNDVIQPTQPEDTSTEAATTNAGWLAQGVTFLIARGHNPLGSQKALSKYLNGQKLTQSQAALVNAVITQYGLPPEGAPVATVAPAPAASSGGTGGGPTTVTKTVKVPRQVHVVTGKQDDNWHELSQLYYNSKSDAAALKIRVVNPKHKSPLKKGERIQIPAGTKKVTTTTAGGGATVQAARTAATIPGDVSVNAGSSATGNYLSRTVPNVDIAP